jgi:alkanesulfonate monooxygenase SsuD/methylene tetrahydromethanopterin reductase-like flavin-dependent oxidoreductase (luciferase family)
MELGLAIDLGSDRDSVATRLTDARRLLALAEEHGFKSVWFGEGYPSRPGSFHLPSSLLMLASVASATSLTLGSGVTLLPAWSLLRLAYDAALLDQASEGRLVLGVGLGTPALWHRFGLPTARMADRADEMLQALRALWRGEDGFQGELVSVDGRIFPLPSQAGGPPVWVGGRVRRSARRAARFGDGWYAATSYRLSEIARMVAAYRLACSEAGREPGPIAVNRIMVVSGERKAARPYIEALLARYVRIGSILGDDGHPVDQAGALALEDELVLAGDMDQVREGLERYARAGVTHLQARPWPSDMPIEMVERTIQSLGGARSE